MKTPRTLRPLPMIFLAAATLLAPLSCQRAYYGTMEAFGSHKRDILASRVEDAREDQQEARDQFVSALDRFNELLGQEGQEPSALRRTYDKLKSELDRSEGKAEDVRKRIAAVESVGEDLFDEWETELEQYQSGELRRASEQQMRDTRARYDELLTAMGRAESRMEPVLVAFRDQVLFLKHNLNAQAVASLRGVAATLENDTAALIREMEASIAEADAFIREMGREG